MQTVLGPPSPDRIPDPPPRPPRLLPVGALVGLLAALVWISWAAPHALQPWLWPVFLSGALAGELLLRSVLDHPVRRLRRLGRILPAPGLLIGTPEGLVFCPDAPLPAHARLAVSGALAAARLPRGRWIADVEIRACPRRGVWGRIGGRSVSWPFWPPPSWP